MAEYKLTYFDARGVTEPIRFLFKYAGINLEDVRLNTDGVAWAKLKNREYFAQELFPMHKETPFGQVPILEHKGKAIGQSLAIARFAAKKAKLTGKNEWEDAEIDATVDTIVDFRQKALVLVKETNEARKKELFEVFVKETFPFYFQKLDDLVKKNNGFFVGGRLTWADIYFVALFTPSKLDEIVGGDLLAEYPNLAALQKKILEIPAIKEWVASRPKTEN